MNIFPSSRSLIMFHSPVICHRLFFAIRPPSSVARQLHQFALSLAPDGKAVLPEHHHVTMDILDDFPEFPERTATLLLEVGASIMADPFTVELDQVVGSYRSIAFRPRRQNKGLGALQRQIEEVRARTGLRGREGYRFSPHLTACYRASRPFSQSIEPVGWRADELVLIHSLVGRTRHELLGRWRLSGGAARQYSLFQADDA